jgi:hypothetical protein
MRAQRERNRRSFRLESLEGRNAPSGGLSNGMGAIHDHRGPQQAEVQDNHRGRDLGQDRDRDRDRDRNDAVDNDVNDNDVNDNDAEENHRGRGR